MISNKPHAKSKRSHSRPIGNATPRPKPYWTGVYLALIAGLLSFVALAEIYQLAEPFIAPGVASNTNHCEFVIQTPSNTLDPWK